MTQGCHLHRLHSHEPAVGRHRPHRRGQGDRLRARAAFGAPLGLWLDPDPDRAHQERRRSQRPDAGRQPRRRMGGPDRARQPDPQPRAQGHQGPAGHPAVGQFPGGDGRPADLADRRRQPQPLLSRRRRRHDHPADRLLDRARPAAGLRLQLRLPLRRQLAHLHPERAGAAPRRCRAHGEGRGPAEGLRRAGELRLGGAAGRRPHLHLGLVSARAWCRWAPSWAAAGW